MHTSSSSITYAKQMAKRGDTRQEVRKIQIPPKNSKWFHTNTATAYLYSFFMLQNRKATVTKLHHLDKTLDRLPFLLNISSISTVNGKVPNLRWTPRSLPFHQIIYNIVLYSIFSLYHCRNMQFPCIVRPVFSKQTITMFCQLFLCTMLSYFLLTFSFIV